jgi:hypothetical protein
MTARSPGVRVAGDRLLQHLGETLSAGERVVIDPPPGSWAALKPALLEHLHERRRRGGPLPQLVNYPFCAIGAGRRGLPLVIAGDRPFFDECAGCGLRNGCSPPVAFHEELQPFGPACPATLWQRFHRRWAAQAGIGPLPELNEFVARAREHLSGPLSGVGLSVEPSVSIGERTVPIARLALFYEHWPRSDPQGHEATIQLVRSFVRLHEILGGRAPTGLSQVLCRHTPFPLHVGCELAPGRPPLVKGYLFVTRFSDLAKRELLRDLARFAKLPEHPAVSELVWGDIEIIGVCTVAERIEAIKVYQRRDPTKDWPLVSLPGLPPDHPAVVLSGGRAYATIDLCARRPRPPKWDLIVRHQLLTGPLLVRRLAGVLGPSGAARLALLVDHREFRVDTVAIALRGGSMTFYLGLS